MQNITITDTIKYVGTDDRAIDLFESQYIVPNGVSYNSYVILDEKIAVMDGVDERAEEVWFQNVGAGKLERVGRGLRSCILLGAVYSVIALGIVLFLGRYLLLLFLNSDETAILENAQWFIMMNSLFYFPLALVNIIRFMIQGMGFSKLAVFAGMFEMVARTLAGFVLVPFFGFPAVGFANPLAWIFADIFLIPAYLYVKRRMEQAMMRQTMA